jgi:hypothetical protein
MGFNKFPSLESFGHVWRYKSSLLGGPVVDYRAKIKLHGTNAGIRIENGEVFAQKKTADITPADDNAGFARWLEPNKDVWSKVKCNAPVTFFGEWAGPGVQSGDVVAKLDHKFFFIFSVQIGDEIITEPSLIEEAMPEDCKALDDVIVLPWAGPVVTVDFSNNTSADRIAEELSAQAEAIGACDPFIKDMFGIEGPGEGIVMVPMGHGYGVMRDDYSSYTFKVKAARHGAKKAKAASRKIEIPAGAKDFVDMFVTDARCMQALTEACEGLAEKSRTGDFLKWMGGDVKKESVVELTDAELEWKNVAKLVNNAAARWFLDRCERPLGRQEAA